VLGRAKDLHDFIKNGEDVARIEIELKNDDGPNVVIRRSFKKSTPGSEWKLNGSVLD
jgi:chromosome segregation ATPase